MARGEGSIARYPAAIAVLGVFVAVAVGILVDAFRSAERREAALGISFEGPLWAARTTFDDEDSPDVGFVADDQPLVVRLTGVAKPVVAQALVNGRVVLQQAACRRPCAGGATVLQLRPPLGTRPGPRSVRLRVLAGGRVAARAGFQVRRALRLPTPSEVEESVARRAATPDRGRQQPDSPTRRAIRRLVDRLPRGSTPTVLATGPRTALIALRPARPMTIGLRQRDGSVASLTTAALRDLLVEADPQGRLHSAQPGPSTPTSAWTGAAPVQRGARAAGNRLVRLSDSGPAFATYDGATNLGLVGRDWPVTLVFHGRATIPKVKAALRRAGLNRRGERRFLAYSAARQTLRFDGDQGLKAACDRSGTDVHVRLYAPAPADRFTDPEWGSVVVATTHLDRADGCGVPPKAFGYSEIAEARVSGLVGRATGWSVKPDALDLGNREPLRRDRADPTHVWLSDGRASTIAVP